MAEHTTIRDRLLATVGGMEAFVSSFSWRTFSPDRRAASAITDAENDIADGLAALSLEGAAPVDADEWLGRYIAKWAKYQAAGARTANPMITGPARFPADRNRKRMEVERKRGEELEAHVKGAAAWARRRKRIAENVALLASLTESGATFVEKEVGGIRMVENTAMDRVQLIFAGRPSDDERAVLKQHAFRWAPSVGAWQRQLTANGLRAAERALATLARAKGPQS